MPTRDPKKLRRSRKRTDAKRAPTRKPVWLDAKTMTLIDTMRRNQTKVAYIRMLVARHAGVPVETLKAGKRGRKARLR